MYVELERHTMHKFKACCQKLLSLNRQFLFLFPTKLIFTSGSFFARTFLRGGGHRGFVSGLPGLKIKRPNPLKWKRPNFPRKCDK